MSNTNEAVMNLHQELDRVRQVNKCSSCECLLDVLENVQGDLEQIGTAEADKARADMQRWLEEGNQNRHQCLGCEVCLPIKPYNQFSAIRQDKIDKPPEISPETACNCKGACGTKPVQVEPVYKWPVMEGNYLLGNHTASIAMCTLADTDLPIELKEAKALKHAAIIGSLATENLGIERVIRNINANPNIRFLVLCGRDSRGHKAGQALICLKNNGVNEQNRIIGAQGPRPFLKNVSAQEIEAFRNNVTVVDEIGTNDIKRLIDVIEACASQTDGNSLIVPPKIKSPKIIMAENRKNSDFEHDPEGFFVIMLDREGKTVVCEHYTFDGELNEVIKGLTAEDIAYTAINRGLLSRLDHAAYLGKELSKAETALNLYRIPRTNR